MVFTREMPMVIEGSLVPPRNPGGTGELRAKELKFKEPFKDSGAKPVCEEEGSVPIAV